MQIDTSLPLEKIIKSLLDSSLPLISNLSNYSSFLKSYFENTAWAGFYIVEGEKLFLGPFQGDIACTIIPIGKGICGSSAASKETIIVPNVHEHPNHIACSSSTNSEIVTPIIKNNKVVAVIDLDSNSLDNYSDDDKTKLEIIASYLSCLF